MLGKAGKQGMNRDGGVKRIGEKDRERKSGRNEAATKLNKRQREISSRSRVIYRESSDDITKYIQGGS